MGAEGDRTVTKEGKRGENKLKAKLYSHKKMELFLDAVPPRYEEKEVGGKVVRDGFGLHCARRKNRKRG